MENVNDSMKLLAYFHDPLFDKDVNSIRHLTEEGSSMRYCTFN